MDALEARPMPMTDDASSPFWSPDSRWIGFFTTGQLRKISVSGGPAQTICEEAAGAGGTWNRDDVIVYSTRERVLRQVPAKQNATASGVTDTKLTWSFPVFLPDRRHFLELVRGSTVADKTGIYLGSLDGKENRRILTDVSNVAFAPSRSGDKLGHILFLRENSLMAQPFDTETGLTSGEAFSVAEGI